MIQYKITALVLCLFAVLLSGCSEESLDSNCDNVFTIALQMPTNENVTRVGVSEIQDTKNLRTEWRDNDQVQVIVKRGNEMYDLGKCKVSSISQDRKKASITIDRRSFPTMVFPFTVYCFTGNNHPASADAIGGGNWAAYCSYDIMRETLESFNAPMYAQIEVNGKDTPVAHFTHFGTYELLHLKNDTNLPITVVHQGFNSSKPWYQASTTVWFYDGFDPTKISGEWEGDVDSPEILIMPHIERTIISWYIPSGFKIDNAQLIATINGKAGITSTNTFSSNVDLQRGHAYHMYATWDGEELKFEKINQNELELSAYMVESTLGYPITINNTSNYWDTRLEVSDETIIYAEHGQYNKRTINITPLRVGQAFLTIIDNKTGKKSTVEVNVSMPLLPEEYVDLGLPSGTLWAKSNLGSNSNGYPIVLFAWGELCTKKQFTEDNYSPSLLNRTTDLSDDLDIAYVASNGKWRMPTAAELKELYEKCYWTFESPSIDMFAYGPNGNKLSFDIHIVKEAYFESTDWHSFYWSRNYVSGQGIPYLYFTLYTNGTNARYGNNYFEYELDAYKGKLIRPVLNQ